MKGLNVYKPRYKIPFQAKTKVFLYKESRLRRFFNIRGWKIVRRGLFKRIVVVLNNMKWTIARRYIRPFAKRRKSAKKERQYIRQFQNKQQIRHFYGKFKEESFRNLFRAHLVGVYSRNNSFYSRLESRVDMFLFRSRNFPTLYAANQYVFHQGIEYDGVQYKSPNAVIGTGTSLVFDEQLWDLFADNLFDKIDYRYFGKEILEKRKHYKLRKKVRFLLRRRNRMGRNQLLYIKLLRKIISMQEYLPKLLKVLSRKLLIKIRKSNVNVLSFAKTRAQRMRKLKIELQKLKKECSLLKNDFVHTTKYRASYAQPKILTNLLKKKTKRVKKYLKLTKNFRNKNKKKTIDIMSKYLDKKNMKAHIFYYLRLTIKLYIKIATFTMNEKKYRINDKLNLVDQKLGVISNNLNVASEDLIKVTKKIKELKPTLESMNKKLKIADIKKLKISKMKKDSYFRLKYITWKLKRILKTNKWDLSKNQNMKNTRNIFFTLEQKSKFITLKNKNTLKTSNLIKKYSDIERINLARLKWYKNKISLLGKKDNKYRRLIQNRRKNSIKLLRKNINIKIINVYSSLINKEDLPNINFNTKTKVKRKKIKKIAKVIRLNYINLLKLKKINNNFSFLKHVWKKNKNNKIIKYIKGLKFKNKIKLVYYKHKAVIEKSNLKRLQRVLFFLNQTKVISKLQNRKESLEGDLKLEEDENNLIKILIKDKYKEILTALNVKNDIRYKLSMLKRNEKGTMNDIKVPAPALINAKTNITKSILSKAPVKVLLSDIKRKYLWFNLRWALPKAINKTIILYSTNKKLKNRELKLRKFIQKNTSKLKALIAIKLQLEQQENTLKLKLINLTDKSTQFIDNYVDSLRIKQRYKRWKIRWARKLDLKKQQNDSDELGGTMKKKEYEYKVWKNGIYYNIAKRRRKRRKRRRASRFRRVHWYIPTYIYFDFESMQSVMTHSPKPKEIFYSFKASLTKLHAFYRSRGL